MFKTININLDFKDLEMIKEALENEISNLNNQIYTTEDNKENIDEYKQLLLKININLKKIQDF
ncbi:hypothetical protein N5912_02640 [Arcobacter lacus]|uniref:hypothetical protein n=1 Tax=Arcobacter lacus TaxID=1912876 RepID=UPI0021BA5D9F|nr:hypothetical protein [Arcobacter lacus]MCT7910717.1 hypothetical protein [Arcobacter lacus]